MGTQHSEGHPEWLPASSGRVAREIRQLRRRAWLNRHGNKVVSGLALLSVAALVVGVYATREPVTEPAPAAAPTTITRVDLADPFRNTPAAYWPDGEAGLVVPEAAAVGTFTKEQVADAYGRARAAVVAARLDRRVLEGRDLEPLLGLFAADDQESLRPLFAGGRDDEAGLVATRIAPGSALLPVDPKVSGGMTIEAKNAGELIVHTDFVFAYAFAVDDVEKLHGPMDIVAVTRVQYDYIMRSGPSFRPESQGMWSGPSTGHSYSIGCTASREGFLAPSFKERTQRGSAREDGRPEDYFDPSKPMPTINTCPT